MKTKSFLTLLTVTAVSVLTLALASCTGGNQDNLRGTNWVLNEIHGVQPMHGTVLTIEFAEEQISGNAGCNHFGGNYTIDGETIWLESIYSTEMACMEPEGAMDQEQVYLEALRSAVRFTQTETELVIFDASERELKFEPYDTIAADGSTGGQNDSVQIDAPPEVPDVEPTISIAPPWEYHRYQDPVTGITVFIPWGWIVTGIIEGEYAILQSYPEDKYVGGEARQEGDTKCDLNIKPLGTSSEELIEQWKASPMTTILSEEPFRLNSGQEGTRFEIENMGISVSFMTELGGRVVVLTCFGEFSKVNEIAATLHQ